MDEEYYYNHLTPNVIYTTVAAVLILGAYLINYNKKSPPPYNSKKYWESRYAKAPSSYDWYITLKDLQASSSSILSSQVLQIPQLRFLELGCGNSSMAAELAAQYPQIDLVSIDYSDTVIEQMRSVIDPRRSSTYIYMDARDMEFKTGSKDYIIDKGTLDAIVSSSSSPSAKNNLDCSRVWNEVCRVSSKSATFLLISCHPPSFWHDVANASGFTFFTGSECHTTLKNDSRIKVFINTYKKK